MKMPEGKFIATVKVGEKGQIVIPKGAREIFSIEPGDTLLLLADRERGIALVPEGRRVFANLTVLENLKIGAYLRKDARKIQEDIEYIYTLFPRLKERSWQLAGTLSGGESFLAALSLALGMSDMVQASAASAVRLDTMFVDEGFGSLSGNFLELAMNELIDTAENGHRLIGIISHVEEVKGRIPRRIEVTKGRTGGSAAQIR